MEFPEARRIVLDELAAALAAVDPDEVERFLARLGRSRRVFAVGVGRVQLALLAFVKRLNHLGFPATYVGAVDEPAITADDLLLVGSGSGETAIPVAIARIARRHGATVVHVGSNPASSVSALADLVVRIPCRTKLGRADEIASRQPMSSLFEQSLLLLGDILALMLAERGALDPQELWRAHANLE